MTWNIPLIKQLGIKYPIFGFSHSIDVAVAIARSGGFPVLGLGRELPEDIKDVVTTVERRMEDMPYGLDLMLPSHIPDHGSVEQFRKELPRAQVEFTEKLRKRFKVRKPTRCSFFTDQVRSEALFAEQIEVTLASNCNAVVTAIGLREDLIRRAKQRGKLAISLVGSVKHAKKALGMGVDVLVAQGYDAGGHTGMVGTMSLLPQILAVAQGRPVLAAGGIATGEQIFGVIGMGAQGGWLGTLWLASKENHTPKALLDRLINGQSEDTVITRAHSGKPCRVIRSPWIEAWSEPSAPSPLPMPLQQVLTGDVFTSMHEFNDPAIIYEAAGQSVFGISKATTVKAQMDRLIRALDVAKTRCQSWTSCVAQDSTVMNYAIKS
ncbi:MAG: nitronate monooxygenase [Burkholderiaceae bacterium]|nr:MAG: nitronate monooxygenase [Burkholderiaceae bacterium]